MGINGIEPFKITVDPYASSPFPAVSRARADATRAVRQDRFLPPRFKTLEHLISAKFLE